MYDTVTDKPTKGQSKWSVALRDNLKTVHEDVKTLGFQVAWKQHTGIPADGNSNPNWKDCQMYLEAIMGQLPGETYNKAPKMPFLRYLDFDWDMQAPHQWQMLLQIAKLYGYLAKNMTRRPKWAGPEKGGWLAWLVNNGKLDLFTSGFANLARLCQQHADVHGLGIDDKFPKSK